MSSYRLAHTACTAVCACQDLARTPTHTRDRCTTPSASPGVASRLWPVQQGWPVRPPWSSRFHGALAEHAHTSQVRHCRRGLRQDLLDLGRDTEAISALDPATMIVSRQRLLAGLGADHAPPRYSLPPPASRPVRARKNSVSASFKSTAASHRAVPLSGRSTCSRQRSSADAIRTSTAAHSRQQCVYPGLRTCRKHPSRGHGGAGFRLPRLVRWELRGEVITHHIHGRHAVDDPVDL